MIAAIRLLKVWTYTMYNQPEHDSDRHDVAWLSCLMVIL